MQVGIALTVSVRNHIDGHPVYGDRNIRTVVDVKTTQENLLRLPAASVLGYE